MHKEFESKTPNMRQLDPDLASFIKSNSIRIDGGEMSNDELVQMSKIVKSAKKIGPVVCELKENKGSDGFILAISKNDILYPTLFVEIGNTKEETRNFVQDANLKTVFIKENPQASSSSLNARLPKAERMYSNDGSMIGGGAFSFRKDWIISVSGLPTPQMNSVAALGIAIGSKLINFDEAITRARDESMECLDLFVKYEDVLTDPFYTEIKDLDEIPEEPHSSI